MQKLDFVNVVESIVDENPRYDVKAYLLVREGLDHTLKNLKRNPGKTEHRHVSGSELLEGLREYTLREFGPMGKMVLNEWGITKCSDFGEIVFNLVQHGILGKSESDRIEDFEEIWSFDEAFVKPFEPSSQKEPLKLRVEKNLKPKRLQPGKKSAAKKKTAGSD